MKPSFGCTVAAMVFMFVASSARAEPGDDLIGKWTGHNPSGSSTFVIKREGKRLLTDGYGPSAELSCDDQGTCTAKVGARLYQVYWLENGRLAVETTDFPGRNTKKPHATFTRTAAAAKEPAKADVDKFLAFFDKLVDVIVENKESCPAMAAAVNKHIDANVDLMKMAADAKAAGKQLPKDAQDHMMASTKKMMGAMQKCGNDAEVQKAFQRLDMSKKGK